MNKSKKYVCIFMFFLIVCVMFLTSCGNNSKDKSNETAEDIKVKDYLSIQTSIAYSSGDTKNWTYGNQRKEFPNNDSCYVRIGSRAFTTGFFDKGKGDSIEVTYRFTGTENCKVEISDGKATKHETSDSNVIEFTRIISVAKEKKAQENILIFRYFPENAESITLEVIYDDQVAEKYDEYNTIYFDKVSDSKNKIH